MKWAHSGSVMVPSLGIGAEVVIFKKVQGQFTLILLLVGSLASGCGLLSARHSGDLELQQNFQVMDQAMVNSFMAWTAANCNSCHGNGASSGGIGGFHSMTSMVASGLVRPGDADNSPLYHSITNPSDPMPPGGLPSSAEQQAVWNAIELGIAPPDPEE